ncbi:MAG: hypothetical protein LBH04_06885 [Tannerellaceae bacterium]|jgi:hypothetical protein|nr:hypothetical protein [Tannerellaceae bacterium]
MNEFKSITGTGRSQAGSGIAGRVHTSKISHGLSITLNGIKNKIILLVFLPLLSANLSFADGGDGDGDPNLYMVIANVIFDEFRFPLIGFANISMNNQALPQIGFVNYNDGDLKSLQLGFTNNVKGDMRGVQVGFSNIALRKLSGSQIGFFNFCDTLESGLPVGIISYMKNGGYHAVELSTAGISIINFSFKTGVEKFYTSLTVSYDEDAPAYSALGFGIGSKISVRKKFFVNPELNYVSKIWGGNRQYFNGDLLLGYNLSKHWGIVLGPEFTVQLADGTTKNPAYKIYNHKFGRNNSFIINGKSGIRFEF